MFIGVFCKFAVPVFFMIAGFNIVKYENWSLKDIFLKKIVRILLLIVITSLIYYLKDTKVANWSIKSFIRLVYTFKGGRVFL